MLNPNTIYFKTEAGVQEVKARVLGLRAELRRLLILIDGNSTLSRLAVFVRGSEIDYLIAELEVQGLITIGAGALSAQPLAVARPWSAAVQPAQPATGELTSPANSPANIEPTSAQLMAVRRTAVRTLHELLGPDATVLAGKIDRSKDAQELRVAITEIRQTLDRRVGTDAGQRFLDAVRTAAEGTR